MAYMNVSTKTDDKLHLIREVSFLSKAVFFGILVNVVAVMVFGSLSLPFKALIGFSAILISTFFTDNYEMLHLDKERAEVCLTKLHISQYLLASILPPCPYVITKLSEIENVRIESSGSQDSKRVHRVVLVLNSGNLLAVTEAFTNNEYSEHERIAKVIKSFLPASDNKATSEDDSYSNQELRTGDNGNASSISDSEDDKSLDDFEHFTKDEIAEVESELEAKQEKDEVIIPSSDIDKDVKVEFVVGSGDDESMIRACGSSVDGIDEVVVACVEKDEDEKEEEEEAVIGSGDNDGPSNELPVVGCGDTDVKDELSLSHCCDKEGKDEVSGCGDVDDESVKSVNKELKESAVVQSSQEVCPNPSNEQSA